jgi:hypothetical protein
MTSMQHSSMPKPKPVTAGDRIKRELRPILIVLALEAAILVRIDLRISPTPAGLALVGGAVGSVAIFFAPKYLLLGGARAWRRVPSLNHKLYRRLFALDLVFLLCVWATLPTYTPSDFNSLGAGITMLLAGTLGLVIGVIGAIVLLLRPLHHRSLP